MTPGAGGSCARAWPYKSHSKNALFPQKSSLLQGKDHIKLSTYGVCVCVCVCVRYLCIKMLF